MISRSRRTREGIADERQLFAHRVRGVAESDKCADRGGVHEGDAVKINDEGRRLLDQAARRSLSPLISAAVAKIKLTAQDQRPGGVTRNRPRYLKLSVRRSLTGTFSFSGMREDFSAGLKRARQSQPLPASNGRHVRIL